MKATRALDPLTVNVVFTIALVVVTWYAWKSRTPALVLSGVALSLLTTYRWLNLSNEPGVLYNDHGYEGQGLFFNDLTDHPNELQSGISMVAGIVELSEKPERFYEIQPGTSAYVSKEGEVKSYSPISGLKNGWELKMAV